MNTTQQIKQVKDRFPEDNKSLQQVISWLACAPSCIHKDIAELSRLWLLHGRHTTVRDVKEAIKYGLPLWPEAVRIARAYHRAKKDLVGGKYYIVGSDFVETEPDSPYHYHELGRYPDHWEIRNLYQKHFEEEMQGHSKHSSTIGAGSDALSPHHLLSKTILSKTRDSNASPDVCARAHFETDKNKHIELLLGGVSAHELDNLQSERNSLDICQISDDGNSECENRLGSSSNTSSRLDCDRQVLSQTQIHDKPDLSEAKSGEEEICSERETSEDVDKGSNKTCQATKEECIDHRPANAVKESEPTIVKRKGKDFTLKPIDLSESDEKLFRLCEEKFSRPCLPLRKIGPILPKEEWIREYAKSLNIDYAPKTIQPDISVRDTSEEENTKVNSEKVVEETDQAVLAKEDSEKNGQFCVDALSLDGNISVKEKPKRCFVYPFDDSSSIVGSDLSGDDAIGTDIFMEISEHRKQEGASSPSAHSVDSNVILPPNVFTWLPQTCYVELLTRFRAPSPSANVEIVLPSPRIASVSRCLSAPKLEEVTVSGDFTKNFNHSGAFALNRGPLRCRAIPLTCNAPTVASSSVSCSISNKLYSDWYHGIKITQHDFLRARFSTTAPTVASSSVSCSISNKLYSDWYHGIKITQHDFLRARFSTTAPQIVEIHDSYSFTSNATNATEFTVLKLADSSSASISHRCFAAKDVDVVSTWIFDQQLGSNATVVLPCMSRRSISYHCKTSLRNRERTSALESRRKRKRSDSIRECLRLLETGAMPSQIIDAVLDPMDDTALERSDDSHSPDRLVIVEELDEEQEQVVPMVVATDLSNGSNSHLKNESSGASCVRVTSKQLSPCERGS
ncbi:hypothetical protein KIN20_032127 [Parelaphostrongylus tenuis]|uniref:Uncharacterized protein n=1 Tax=Parelaphostrongylus tenuis TaxID=148309 RepID=A0AAD5R6J3_PARTN|nr:hypothetical protein KIN20_032127 [Parelaphostrongylus tenuis]